MYAYSTDPKPNASSFCNPNPHHVHPSLPPAPRRGQHPWSFTGSRGAQPDGEGSEHCLAVLNNFYNVSILAWRDMKQGS